MGFLSCFTELGLFAIELMVIFLLCIGTAERRAKFLSRVLIATAVFICLVAVFSVVGFFLLERYLEWWILVCEIVAAILAVVWVQICFKTSLWTNLFCFNIALASRYLGVKAAETVVQVITVSGGNVEWYVFYVLRYAVLAVVYAVVYLLYVSVFKGRLEQFSERNASYFVLLFIAVNAVLAFVEIFIRDFDATYLLILCFCEAFYALVSLFIAYALTRQEQSGIELSIVRQLWYEDRKHYELQKENMDIINIKCHDLRHQIRSIREKGTVDNSMIDELEQSIHIYDSVMKTENEALDVTLSHIALRCQKNNIQLTCMADGKKLDFMDDADVYSLFGNILENALEYELTIKKEDDRFISLVVRTSGDLVQIHAENYFEGSLSFADGLPVTTKQDKNYHGFGMKSIRRIAEKYDGQCDVHIADDMFQVDILFPAAGRKKEGEVK